MIDANHRDETITRLFPIVHKAARYIVRGRSHCPELDELVGDGCVALVKAVDRYDAHYGVKLEVYVWHTVLGAMMNTMRRHLPTSERHRRRVREGEALRADLLATGSDVSNEAIEARIPGFTRSLQRCAIGFPLSLDAPLPHDVELPVDGEGDPARVFELDIQQKHMRTLIAALPARLRAIIEAHYSQDHSLYDIAADIGVTPQRVSQLHRRALTLLREAWQQSERSAAPAPLRARSRSRQSTTPRNGIAAAPDADAHAIAV